MCRTLRKIFNYVAVDNHQEIAVVGCARLCSLCSFISHTTNRFECVVGRFIFIKLVTPM